MIEWIFSLYIHSISFIFSLLDQSEIATSFLSKQAIKAIFDRKIELRETFSWAHSKPLTLGPLYDHDVIPIRFSLGASVRPCARRAWIHARFPVLLFTRLRESPRPHALQVIDGPETTTRIDSLGLEAPFLALHALP